MTSGVSSLMEVDYPQSQDILEKLRGTMDGAFNDLSSMAACLLPLLRALDWQGSPREIAEALPHFVNEIELVDLRNALVNLGFETYAEPEKLKNIDHRLVPCLFVSDMDEGKEENVYVVLNADNGVFKVWLNGEILQINSNYADFEGTAYYISKAVEQSVPPKPHIFGWFGRILGRFKHSIQMLFAVSLFSNLIGIVFPIFIMFIYDHVIRMQSISTLPMLVLGILIFLAADTALRYIRSKIIGFIAGRLDYVLGAKTFERIFGLPTVFTERAAVSVQLSRIKEFESIRDFFTGSLVGAVIDIPFVFLALGVIAAIAGPLAFLPLATILIYLVLGLLLLPSSRQLKKEASLASRTRDDLFVEMVLNRSSIKDMAGEDVWLDRFRLASAEASRQKQKSENHEATMDAVCHMVQMLSGLAILSWGAHLVIQQEITIGVLIATMILCWKVLSPIQSAFMAYTKLDQILNSTKQLNNLMNLKSEGNAGKARLLANEIKGNIVFDRVSFRYNADSDPALMGVNLEIKQNSIVAITGGTSSGKTTILKLLLGLYLPQGGLISVGGLDLRQIDPRDLRCKISYAAQDLQFFYGTIEQNLRLADPTASENQLRRSVDAVGLLEFIENLPEKFQTRINGDQTDQFAPGILQRLNIARALVRDTNILLLDEPAQRLDFEGDMALVEHLKSLRGKKTIVMVSHRPSHVRLADKAIIMNKGMIEFEGDPEQALEITMNLKAQEKSL